MSWEQLVVDNYPLIYSMIKAMGLKTQEQDKFQEWVDDGLMGLINGAKTYDESKDIAPSTYLCRCIRNEIARGNYLRNMQVRVLNYMPTVPLDKDLGDSSSIGDFVIDQRVDIEKEVEKSALIDKVIFAIEKLYSEEDADDFFRIHGLKGYREHTCSEIAIERGLSKAWICNRDSIMMRKLKWFMNYYKEDVSILRKRKLIIERRGKALKRR